MCQSLAAGSRRAVGNTHSTKDSTSLQMRSLRAGSAICWLGGGELRPHPCLLSFLVMASGKAEQPGWTTILRHLLQRCSRAELQAPELLSLEATCWGAIPTKSSLETCPLSSLPSRRPSIWMPSPKAVSYRLPASQALDPGPGVCPNGAPWGP